MQVQVKAMNKILQTAREEQEDLGKRRSRRNTVEEKRRMRGVCKRNMRKSKSMILKKAKLDLKSEIVLREKAQQEVAKYKGMSRCFWERWRWELHKRKEAMVRELGVHKTNKNFTTEPIMDINPSMLSDPVIDGVQQEIYAGRGSFGVVKLQLYRGITVAVKEFLPHTIRKDVVHEASILASLCHPYLPLLYGMCNTLKSYYRIVMQFHAYTVGSNNAATIEQRLLKDDLFKDEIKNWPILCAQLFEAIAYLHNEKKILHNDIKVNNILITSSQNDVHIVLIDFGKATYMEHARRYSLSEFERREHVRNFPHIAPEIIKGETRQSAQGDMFSIGLVMYKLIDSNCFKGLPRTSQNKLEQFAASCRSVNYSTRPKSTDGLKIIEDINFEN